MKINQFIKKILLFFVSLAPALYFVLPFGELPDIFLQKHKENQVIEKYTEPLGEDQLSFEWLGANGFRVEKNDFVILIDPYITRIPFYELFIQPIHSDKELIKEKIPQADYIFVTDTHFDHFMDVPEIALQTGAKVVGSSIAAKLMRVHNVPEDQIVEVKGGELLEAGPFTVKVGEAEHGTIFFVKPFYGDHVDMNAKPPFMVWQYVNIDNLCFRFLCDDFSFFITSGVGFDDNKYKGFEADLLIANVMTVPPDYAKKVLGAIKPKMVFPVHYDNCFEPFTKGIMPWPCLDFNVFCNEVERYDDSIPIVTFDFFQEYRVNQRNEKDSEEKS